MSNNKFFSNPLGKERIYPDQQSAADEVLKCFSEHKTSAIVKSQPQTGKTGCGSATIYGFRETCKANGHTYQIIFICNIADNALREQSRQRFKDAKLITLFDDSSVEVYHQGELDKIVLKNVDKRLFIFDECHIALGKGRPFHNFLTRCGIAYDRPVAEWADKRNYVLSLSATPYAHELKNKKDNGEVYTIIRMKESVDCFTSVKLFHSEIKDKDGKVISKRLLQMKDLVSKKSITPFLTERLNAFGEACKEYGNGFLLIRAPGPTNAILKKHFAKIGMQYKEFSQRELNIHLLNEALHTEPPCPYVILIKNAMRAGQTLDTTRFIRGVLETVDSHADSTVQAVSRHCGHRANYDNWSKFDDQYPIYCDVAAFERAVKNYEDDSLIPEGIQNSNSVSEKKEWDVLFLDDTETNRDFLRKDGTITLSVGKFSDNPKHNIPAIILAGNNSSARSNAWLVDYMPEKPEYFTSEEGNASFQSFLQKYPDSLGKIVYRVQKGTTVSVDYQDKVSKKCMLTN